MLGGDHVLWSGGLADLPPAERLVLVVLAAHAGEDGRCWPSVARLSQATGYSARQVKRALANLSDAGVIETVESRDNRNLSTVRRLALDRVTPTTPGDTHDTGPVTPTSPPGCLPRHPPGDTHDTQKNQQKNQWKDQGRTNTRLPAVIADHLDVSQATISVDIRESEIGHSDIRDMLARGVPESEVATRNTTPTFTDFWDIYPRTVAKGAAIKAWDKAIKRETPQRILDGAIRYANGPLPETRYIPHAATWLNGDRWDDEPETPTHAAEPKGFAGIRAALESRS